MSPDEAKRYIHTRIKEEGFVYTNDTLWLTPAGQQAIWTFDLKALFLDKAFLNAVCCVFWERFDKTQPIQICGLESASIPLVAALVLSGDKANGLFIRKSRKKKYDLREIEGTFTDAPIVVVDDILNFGVSLEKQIKILKKHAYDVSGVFACAHLQPLAHYHYLKVAYGITPFFLFGLEDFGEKYKIERTPMLTFNTQWERSFASQHEFNVTHRNQMRVANNAIYLNADDGYVHALSKKNGDTYWKTRVQKSVPNALCQPGIVSQGEFVYAATEHGEMVVLRARDGSVLSRTSVADHIYGDVCLLNEHQIVFTGKQGGSYVAMVFDFLSEKVIWEFRHQARIAKPTLSTASHSIIIATEAGAIMRFASRSGAKLWQIETGGAITADVCIDATEENFYAVTANGMLSHIRISDGQILRSQQIDDEGFFFTAPKLANGQLYLTTLHRTLYCFDEKTLTRTWEFNTRGRIFCGVTILDRVVFFGNNEGVLYAVDERNGTLLGRHVIGDRIVSEPVCEETGIVYVATIGNTVSKLVFEKLDTLVTQ